MSRVPLVVLPRELGQVPPPEKLIGHKARGLAQLLALKARVPRFGILTAEAFDAHVAQDDVRNTMAVAHQSGFPDEASRLAHGEAMVRAVLRNPLPVTVRIGLHEILGAFAEEDLLAVRASVVGEPLEAAVVTGALDSALGVKGKEALEDAVLRIIALAFHPRTLGLREAAGLPAVGCRMAVVVQRMVLSESSGVCVSLETGGRAAARRPSALVRGCWGLGGGIGGKHGSPRIPSDLVRVERPTLAADGLDDDARVETEIAQKNEQLKLDPAGKGARMQPVLEHLKKEACVSPVQARMVAREALRLEAAFGKPQVMSWAFAGRLLHVLDVEPLLVPVARVESDRQRTWDDRLLPTGLLAAATPLTFSVWQRAAARGVERAGRILGVKGVILEDTRPQMPRLVGQVSGRVYANLEVLSALLDLLPFADKARAALAAATGQAELVPRKAPPPGFWQRQRQKLDEGRWPGQLEKISASAFADSERFRGEVEAVLDKVRGLRVAALDPDSLIDLFDELEDALSKAVAALVLSGLAALLYMRELDAAAAESGLSEHAGLLSDLLGGEVPGDLVELSRRAYAITELVRRRPPLEEMLRDNREHLDSVAVHLLGEPDGLDDDERRLGEELRAVTTSAAATCTGELTLEGPRLWERPDAVLEMVLRLLPAGAGPDTLDALARKSSGARKKAEYAVEVAGPRMKSAVRKRLLASLEGVRKHGRDAALLWIPAERVVDRLRIVGMALGERLFEHGLLDQPRDFLYLTTPELSGLVRGTGVDQDGKSMVAARKRQATVRPMGLPKRLETRGVVATSLWNDDEEDEAVVTSPGEQKELSGRSVAAGVVNEPSVILDMPLGASAPPAPLPARAPNAAQPPATQAVPGGVVVVSAPTLATLPLLLVARAVVAERGNIWGPASYALRACGVPTVVDAPQATAFSPGEPLHVDGARGTVKRVVRLAPETRPSPPAAGVDPAIFAREAVLSNPRLRAPAHRPAQPLPDLQPPPIVRPAPTGRIGPSPSPPPPRAVAAPPPALPVDDESGDFVALTTEFTAPEKRLEEIETEDDDVIESIDSTDSEHK